MKRRYYILLDEQNIIRDVVTYPADGYVPVEIEDPLPPGFYSGWYKWENGTYVKVPELEPVDKGALLEQRIADIELAIAAILGGAV